MENPTDLWLVEIDGQQYEADTDTVKAWILDGYVSAQTRVQKGSLKPIEAGRAPAFRSLFSGFDPSATLPTDPVSSYTPTADQSWGNAPNASWGNATQAGHGGGSWESNQNQGSSWDHASGSNRSSYDSVQGADTNWQQDSGTMYAGPEGQAYGTTPDNYAQQRATVGGATCVTHTMAPAKFMCQGCRAALCNTCVKRYSNTAVCSLCGQLCRPYAEATAQLRKSADRYSGFGMNDFGAAIVYPFKDPVAMLLAGLLYGIVTLFGWYGGALGAGLLFGYMSSTIRRVARGRYEDGPAPDLSDPIDLIWDAIKTGIAVTLISFGPLIAVILLAGGNAGSLMDEEGGFNVLALGAIGIAIILAILWAIFYYPMALLVAGYTADFLSTLNPMVGLVTMWKMGTVYVKAYFMAAFIYVAGIVIHSMLGLIEPIVKPLGSVAIGFGYLSGSILQGMVAFFVSIMVAAILGLAVYKRADELDVYIN